jgi:UDP-glucose 4-epimerase
MRVVVTGATGNVGTSLLTALGCAEEVTEIVGVARRAPAIEMAKVSWWEADVSSSPLEALLRDADAVVHLAWLIQPSRDERLTRRVNVEGSARVFEAAARAEVPTLVYASSVGAYAPGPNAEACVDESWPTTGVASSFYSRQKAEVERMLDGFERRHPDVRVVRLRPALTFKALAATGIRRSFAGPFLPNRLLRKRWLPILPFPCGLRTQAVHSDDVADAYLRALLEPVSGAFNVAAEPVLDAASLASALDARPLELPPRLARVATAASWHMRLQPTSPGWLDMGMLTPLMDTARARTELGWNPTLSALDAVLELLEGMRSGADIETPPLDHASSGPLRSRELLTGVGTRDD